jgi:hypothetical protein
MVNRVEQQFRERHDIGTGETYVLTSLKAKHFEESAVLLPGCANLGLQMKAVELQLMLLMTSSHRLLIIRSPHSFTKLW